MSPLFVIVTLLALTSVIAAVILLYEFGKLSGRRREMLQVLGLPEEALSHHRKITMLYAISTIVWIGILIGTAVRLDSLL